MSVNRWHWPHASEYQCNNYPSPSSSQGQAVAEENVILNCFYSSTQISEKDLTPDTHSRALTDIWNNIIKHVFARFQLCRTLIPVLTVFPVFQSRWPDLACVETWQEDPGVNESDGSCLKVKSVDDGNDGWYFWVFCCQCEVWLINQL